MFHIMRDEFGQLVRLDPYPHGILSCKQNPNPPPGRPIQSPPAKRWCKSAVFRYAPEPYFQPICWPIFTLKYFDNPNLTSEAACLIRNVPLQIMKGFGTLYATARSKDRMEIAVEFKVALSAYLKLRL